MLLVRAPSGRKLSKDHVAFNRLVERIAELERTIDTERDKREFLLERYHERLAPLERAVADEQLALAKALAGAAEHCALRGASRKRLRAMVATLCDEAFYRIKPDAETEAFYDDWSDLSYRENLEQQLADPDDREVNDEAFGPDDDEAEHGDYDAAAEADVAAERKGRRDSEGEAYDDAARDGRAFRSDRREARLERKAIAARKSVRDVYLTLAKVLHPDTVVDPAERTRRQDFMKQASSAYRAGDLAALLRLELTWIRRDESRLESLSATRLRTYIPSLKEQVSRLEDDLAALVSDPRYAAIDAAAYFPRASAKVRIEQCVRDTKATIRHIRSLILNVKSCRDSAALTNFLRRMG
ncbi:MAG: hypothetical protein ABR587_09945 [Candidatus Binatia bacterium]